MPNPERITQSSLIFSILQSFPYSVSSFPLGRETEIVARGGLETSHDQQQSEIVTQDLHQEETKQGQKCSYFNWTSRRLSRGGK